MNIAKPSTGTWPSTHLLMIIGAFGHRSELRQRPRSSVAKGSGQTRLAASITLNNPNTLHPKTRLQKATCRKCPKDDHWTCEVKHHPRNFRVDLALQSDLSISWFLKARRSRRPGKRNGRHSHWQRRSSRASSRTTVGRPRLFQSKSTS